MHILVTNDDGPPSPTSSPYVHNFIRALQSAGHIVSVCLPHTQRSWIGKAHMIGETVKPSYYQPPPTFDPRKSAPSHQGTTNVRPSSDPNQEEWVLFDGTPASCAQIGLNHFFADRGPIDLVVSGPNYGRNTTAVFALSSGTLGGALEAAVCRKKAVALSYAFFNKNHDPSIIEGASRHSVRVIEKLYAQWPKDGSVDLYSVNVPLVEGVGERKTMWTGVLQNYWSDEACFEEVEGSVGDGEEEESRIREGEGEGGSAEFNGEAKDIRHRHFKWAPKLDGVHRSVDKAPPGNDGWAVKEGFTSVTPLKANFWHAATELHGNELLLEPEKAQDNSKTTNIPQETSLAHQPKNHFYALIDYEDPYVQPLIISALKRLFPKEAYTLLPAPKSDSLDQSEIPLAKLVPDGNKSQVLQVTPYEAIDWDYVDSHPDTCVVNSYMLRKALIRKHYLTSTVENWTVKRTDSVLRTHVKRGEAFELDYAEFLHDALVEAFDLRASLERNDLVAGAEDREWWILKPGMSDRGQGIRLFSTMDELQGIFDEWEESVSDSEEEEAEDDDEDKSKQAANLREEGLGDGIMTSHLRHFVAQPYIHPPLLLPGDNRKFHIRTYVLNVGSLDVYVYRDMLALFAGKPYMAPWETADGEHHDLEAHLTNTCLQRSVKDGTVQKFWDINLPSSSSGPDAAAAETLPSKEDIFAQICDITGEVFEAAAKGMMMHFQPLPNAFEVYGIDFLVDASGTAWLLEINSFPDFKQTGDELQGLVAELWEGALSLAVKKLFTGFGPSKDDDNGAVKKMMHVRHVDLGRRWGGA